ncbi:hypothetical protein K466DRAFT_591266 [Polyporus arcularius HHB13444]|uniref:Uncharacterized protein n=1 Tax=Polyporus arcularius HHB13444 TaxID=1314778 RepID=A0A5C3NVD1_9APHY|nr:hypothetical protein K466DRAFT_591266 [Polyporus arcularius HHB13444]
MKVIICKQSLRIGESSPATPLSQPSSSLCQYEFAAASNRRPCTSLPRRQALPTSAYAHRPSPLRL